LELDTRASEDRIRGGATDLIKKLLEAQIVNLSRQALLYHTEALRVSKFIATL
jgi:histone H3/H4